MLNLLIEETIKYMAKVVIVVTMIFTGSYWLVRLFMELGWLPKM